MGLVLTMRPNSPARTAGDPSLGAGLHTGDTWSTVGRFWLIWPASVFISVNRDRLAPEHLCHLPSIGFIWRPVCSFPLHVAVEANDVVDVPLTSCLIFGSCG